MTLSWNPYKSLAEGSSSLYYNVKATKLLAEENEAPQRNNKGWPQQPQNLAQLLSNFDQYSS